MRRAYWMLLAALASLAALAGLATVASLAAPAFAQQRPSCEQRARDYANIVAPRTGGALVGSVQGAPVAGRRPTAPAGDQTGWGQMAPNQNAWRMAYEACMARGR